MLSCLALVSPEAMVAMAAIVAQNGATGQSLVEQFTTGVAS